MPLPSRNIKRKALCKRGKGMGKSQLLPEVLETNKRLGLKEIEREIRRENCPNEASGT